MQLAWTTDGTCSREHSERSSHRRRCRTLRFSGSISSSSTMLLDGSASKVSRVSTDRNAGAAQVVVGRGLYPHQQHPAAAVGIEPRQSVRPINQSVRPHSSPLSNTMSLSSRASRLVSLLSTPASPTSS